MMIMLVERLGDGTDVVTRVASDGDLAVVVAPDGQVYGPYPTQEVARSEGLSHHPSGSIVQRLWLPITDREYESDAPMAIAIVSLAVEHEPLIDEGGHIDDVDYHSDGILKYPEGSGG